MDKAALGKAIVICGLSWAAIPFLYYMFKRREKHGRKDEAGSMGKETVEKQDASGRSGESNRSLVLLGNVDEKEELLKSDND